MTAQPRVVARVIQPTPVIEGAGVRLRRSIATATLDYLDPFLLLDNFQSDDPDDYLAGFPWHPTAASRPSPTCWPARWTTGTASATPG